MIMIRKPVDWKEFRGRTFQTTMGARFTVVRVTAKNVTIRPERGTRNYAISIQDESQRVLDDYAVGRFFPSPTELLRSGERAVPSSYAWGILHAMLVNEGPDPKLIAARAEGLAGHCRIIELSELGEDYFAGSDEPPYIEIDVPNHERVHGQYHFGLSDGNLDGKLRQFGGESVLLFGYEGTDEMDRVNGSGWAQPKNRAQLVGEFLGPYGRFTAERVGVRAKWSRSRPARKKG